MDINITVTGPMSQADRRAGMLIIERENEKRNRELDPETGEPLQPPLPFDTPAAIMQSYAAMIQKTIETYHVDIIRQANDVFLSELKSKVEQATDEQRQAAIDALES